MALIYPVDLNERYSIYNPNTGDVVIDGKGRPQHNRKWPNLDGTQVSGVVLLDVNEAKPSFDAATQKLERADWVYDLVAETATRGWNIVALSQTEIDTNTDNADREVKRDRVGNAVATLRTWATQAAGVTVTQGNAIATLQLSVERQGKFFDHFADLLEGQRFDQ